MALLPSIPTSFVPHTPGAQPQRFKHDFTGAFGFFAYGVLFVVFLLAIGVFMYGGILRKTQAAKDAEITKAEASIDTTTVEGFVKLRNRLTHGTILLNKHVAFSTFFGALGSLLPANVRFTSLQISLDTNSVARVEASGVAKSFNSLAALSTSLADDGRIKDAIFSKININKNGTVSFDLSASLDPKLVAFDPTANALAAPAPAPVATTTPPATAP